MLAIKLQRVGRKHQPSYRIVVAERRSKMAAPPVEDLGSYHPETKKIAVKKERISYWMSIGAQPTVTAHNLFVAQGVISSSKKAVKMPKPVAAAEEPAKEPAAAEQAEVPNVEQPAEVSGDSGVEAAQQAA